MTFCANCGQQLAPDTRFCGGCGSSTDAPAPEAPSEAPNPTQQFAAPPPATPQPPQPQQPYGGPQQGGQFGGQPYAAPQQPGAPSGGPQQPYAAPPQGQFGQPQGQFGQPQGQFGQPQGQFGAPPGQFGAPPGQFSGAPYGPPQPKEMPAWARHLVVGNWVGAAIIAAAALVPAALLAIVLGVLAKPTDFGLGNTLTSIVALMGNAFGADTFFREESGSEMVARTGLFPLTITLAVGAAIVLVYRRVTARYSSPLAAFTDAVRAGLIAAVVMTVLALVVRGDEEGLTANAFVDSGRVGGELTWGLSAPGAFFMTLCLIVTVLGITTLMRRDWLGPRAAAVHDWAAGPVRGLVALSLALPVAGLIGYVVGGLFGDGSLGAVPLGFEFDGDDSDRLMSSIAGAVAYAGNFGLMLLVVGTGGKIGSNFVARYDGNRDRESSMEHLMHYTDTDGVVDVPGLWVAVVLAPLCLAFATWAVAQFRSQTNRPNALQTLMVWVASLAVIAPALIRLANFHGAGSDGDARYSQVFGADGPISVLILVLYAALIAFIVALATGAIDGNALRGQTQQFATMAQHDPGQQQWGAQQQPPQQQWGAQQQPGQQQWGQQPGQQQWGAPPPPPGQQQWGQQQWGQQPEQQPWAQPGETAGQQAAQAPYEQPTGPQQWGTPGPEETPVEQTMVSQHPVRENPLIPGLGEESPAAADTPPADEEDGYTRRREVPPSDS